MDKPILYLQDYLPKQVELEEQYYEKLNTILLILVSSLLNYMDNDQIILSGVINIKQSFMERHLHQIKAINNSATHQIQDVTNYATNNISTLNTVQIVNDLDVKVINLINTIVGRFVNLIPAGYNGSGTALYDAETTRQDIIDRYNGSLDKYVQHSISQTVSNKIVNNLLNMGYTKYQANNVHDERVRATHKRDNDNVTWHSLTNPPEADIPGVQWGCRCSIVAVR
jgi:hypothetical protein